MCGTDDYFRSLGQVGTGHYSTTLDRHITACTTEMRRSLELLVAKGTTVGASSRGCGMVVEEGAADNFNVDAFLNFGTSPAKEEITLPESHLAPVVTDTEIAAYDVEAGASAGAAWLERLKVILNHRNQLAPELQHGLSEAVSLCRQVRDSAQSVPAPSSPRSSPTKKAQPPEAAKPAWMQKILYETVPAVDAETKKALAKYGYPAGSLVRLTALERPSGAPVRKNVSIGDVGVVCGVYDARMVVEFEVGQCRFTRAERDACIAPAEPTKEPPRAAADVHAANADAGDAVRWPADKEAGPREPFVTVVHSEAYLQHVVPRWHVESVARVGATMESLLAMPSDPRIRLLLNEMPVPDSVLQVVHDPRYLRQLQETVQKAGKGSRRLNRSDSDTFVSQGSYHAALSAGGTACKAVELVMDGETTAAFCCIRPPGHHAGRRGGGLGECGQGFCLVNNAALGAAHARLKYTWCSRVCVVDWDVHHGNGTEEIFEGDDETLFFSVHRHGENFFPRTGLTNSSTTGNIALREGFGPDDFRAAITSFIQRIAAFKPHLILISAGFDAHEHDPLGGAKVRALDFHWATERLLEVAAQVCQGRVVSVLEGGYDVASLGECVLSHVSALAGKEPYVPPPAPKNVGKRTAGHQRGINKKDPMQYGKKKPPAKKLKKEEAVVEEAPAEEEGDEEEISEWVMCDDCNKWRRLSEIPPAAKAGTKWTCSMAPLSGSCDDPEEEMDSAEETDAEDAETTEWSTWQKVIVRYLMAHDCISSIAASDEGKPEDEIAMEMGLTIADGSGIFYWLDGRFPAGTVSKKDQRTMRSRPWEKDAEKKVWSWSRNFLCAKLRLVRDQRGVTSAALGSELGVSSEDIVRWEAQDPAGDGTLRQSIEKVVHWLGKLECPTCRADSISWPPEGNDIGNHARGGKKQTKEGRWKATVNDFLDHCHDCEGLTTKHALGGEGEWSEHGTAIFKRVLQHGRKLKIGDIPGLNNDDAKEWLKGQDQLLAVCKEIGDKAWRWVSEVVRHLLEKRVQSSEYSVAQTAADIGGGVTAEHIVTWTAEGGGDEGLKQHANSVVYWLGSPPEWECSRCGKKVDEFGSLALLHQHHNVCKGSVMAHSDGDLSEWSEHGVDIFSSLTQHKQILGNKSICNAIDMQGRELEYVKWRDEIEMLQEVCVEIGSKAWEWVSVSVRDLMQRELDSRSLTPAKAAGQMGVPGPDVVAWAKKSGGDANLMQHVKKVVDWIGAPPEWECTKCGKELEEFGSMGGLISHFHSCRGPLMIHTQVKDGEWSQHGTDAFETIMDMCGITTAGDRCKAIEGSSEITKIELTNWCQEIDMPETSCKIVGRQAWRWISPQVRRRLKALLGGPKLSPKEAASQIGVSEKDVAAWSSAAEGDKGTDKSLKQHISKVVKWIQAQAAGGEQAGSAGPKSNGKRAASASPNPVPAKRQQRSRQGQGAGDQSGGVAGDFSDCVVEL